MKIALIGATGNAGSRILNELLMRGYTVTAIVRNPNKVPQNPKVVALAGDVFDQAGLAKLIKGHDAVISAVHFTASDPRKLIEAVRSSGVKRYLVVGGAGSFDTPEFPTAYKAGAAAGGVFLDLLRQEKQIDWTFLSPSAMFVPGERTGKFRLGTDQLLANDQGSSVSFEDFAIALVDELENPQHSRRRFTVGY